MTLTERIAKRLADGWTLSHWVVKSHAGYLTGTCEWSRDPTYKARFRTHQDAQRTNAEGRIVPVFTRTIRTNHGHGFGWALARMKEGKTVMRIGNPSRLAMREGWLIDFYNNTKVQSIASEAIEANTWELAE